jgi:glycerophosphoryl diester phosphodiesterase
MTANDTALYTEPFHPIAHRGGSLEKLENSSSAFQNAWALGYRYMETDMQASSDGVVYIFHDDRLERVSNGTGLFCEHSSEEIDALRLNNGEPIPRLADVLEALPEALFNIDIKRADGTKPLADFLSTHPEAHRVVAASFVGKRLRALKAMVGRTIPVTAVQNDIIRIKLIGLGLPLARPDVVAVQVPISHYGIKIVTPSFIKNCHDLGIKVHVWTIDDEAEMRWLIDLGVDGVMTDKPSLLKQVCLDMGCWLDRDA